MKEGQIYAMYFFQMALASTATTIVSGAMAERTNLRAYMLYSFVSTLTTCFPAHWIWGKGGFLREMGVVDIAGCSGTNSRERLILHRKGQENEITSVKKKEILEVIQGN